VILLERDARVMIEAARRAGCPCRVQLEGAGPAPMSTGSAASWKGIARNLGLRLGYPLICLDAEIRGAIDGVGRKTAMTAAKTTARTALTPMMAGQFVRAWSRTPATRPRTLTAAPSWLPAKNPGAARSCSSLHPGPAQAAAPESSSSSSLDPPTLHRAVRYVNRIGHYLSFPAGHQPFMSDVVTQLW
jgi:hypothetical protein